MPCNLMMAFRLLVFLGLVSSALPVNAQNPTWPVPGKSPSWPMRSEDFLQPTASGKAESALFGCVRSNGKRFHEAVDIAPVRERRRGEATDPILAIHDGIVRHVSTVAGNSSYGRYVVVEHPDLNLGIYSLYAHLAKIEPGLTTGSKVSAGDRLGIMGRSAGGYSIPRERAHLHLEVGLRLSGTFDEWYRRQAYTTANQHGDFNGMNLIGWDPLDYYEASASVEHPSPLDFIEQLEPAVMLHVMTSAVPDFITRYPGLVLPGCSPAEREGWEILLSPWGLPLSLKPLRGDALRGVSKQGDISVVGINRAALGDYECRRIVEESNGQSTLGSGGRRVMELLFMPDPRSN